MKREQAEGHAPVAGWSLSSAALLLPLPLDGAVAGQEVAPGCARDQAAAPAAQLQSQDIRGEQYSLVSRSLEFSTIKGASGISFTKPQALSSDQLIAHCPV